MTPFAKPVDLTGGACINIRDKYAFHPEGAGKEQQEKYALSVCAACPIAVRDRCLVDILKYEAAVGACHGVVGGLREDERAQILGWQVRHAN